MRFSDKVATKTFGDNEAVMPMIKSRNLKETFRETETIGCLEKIFSIMKEDGL